MPTSKNKTAESSALYLSVIARNTSQTWSLTESDCKTSRYLLTSRASSTSVLWHRFQKHVQTWTLSQRYLIRYKISRWLSSQEWSSSPRPFSDLSAVLKRSLEGIRTLIRTGKFHIDLRTSWRSIVGSRPFWIVFYMGRTSWLNVSRPLSMTSAEGQTHFAWGWSNTDLPLKGDEWICKSNVMGPWGCNML